MLKGVLQLEEIDLMSFMDPMSTILSLPRDGNTIVILLSLKSEFCDATRKGLFLARETINISRSMPWDPSMVFISISFRLDLAKAVLMPHTCPLYVESSRICLCSLLYFSNEL